MSRFEPLCTMAQGGQKVQDVYFNISFDKTSSKSFKKPKYIIKMVVKTPLSSTDPIKEQEDGWSLDLENVHLQRGSLDKSCSKSFRQLKYIIKMVVKTSYPPQIQSKSKRTGGVLN